MDVHSLYYNKIVDSLWPLGNRRISKGLFCKNFDFNKTLTYVKYGMTNVMNPWES